MRRPRFMRTPTALLPAVLAAGLWFFWSSSLWAKELNQYIVRLWNTDDGLPQNSVVSLIQASDGFIWFGTHEGLVRFDGFTFRVFQHENTPNMDSNLVNAVCEGRDGRIWFASNQAELYYLDRNLNCFKGPSLGLEDDSVTCMVATRDGTIYIGTRKNEGFVLRDDRVKGLRLDARKPDTIWDYQVDDMGRLWVASRKGLYLVEGERITRFGEDRGLPSDRVWCLELDLQGRLWVGTSKGLCFVENDEIVQPDLGGALLDPNVFCMEEDTNGILWIGMGNGGLAGISPEAKLVQSFSQEHGLPYNTVATLCPDREGNMWVGVESGGLLRFRDGPVTTFTTEHGLPHNMVRSVTFDGDGVLWAATDGGLLKIEDEVLGSFGREQGLPGEQLECLYADPEGGLWIGSFGTGLIHYRDGEFKVYDADDGMTAKSINRILRDRNGTLWIATRQGLMRFRDNRFRTFTTADGLSSNLIINLLEAHDGTLWIATRGGGLNQYRNGVFDTLDHRHGLSSDQVLALYEDAEGVLWAGTSDNGLNRIRDRRITHVNMADGLYDDKVLEILEDDQQRFWMSSNHGVYLIPRAEINAYMDATGSRQLLRCTVFTTEDGMRSAECNGGAFPAGALGPDGQSWFPTIQGLTVMDANQMYRNPLPPPIHITEVRVDGKPYDPAIPALLPAGAGKLEIHYTALSFAVPGRVRFRTMLEGIDHEPIDAGNRRTAFYTNLPPGKYRFIVKGSNNDGLWNEEGAMFEFEQQGFFYQGPWFKVLLVALLLGSLWLLDRIRFVRIHKRQVTLERLVSERTDNLQRTHGRLVTAQEQVIEAAHRAGMAEIAYNVLHQVEDAITRVRSDIEQAHGLLDANRGPKKVPKVLTRIEALPGGYMSLRHEDSRGGELRRELVQEVAHLSTQRSALATCLGKINNQIYQLTQIVSAQQKYAKQDNVSHPVDINQLIADAIKIKGKDLRAARVALNQDLEPLPTYYLQRAKLLRIFLNLLQHACECMATNEEDRPRRLMIRTFQSTREIIVEMRDSGPAVTPADLPRLFAQGGTARPSANRFLLHACATAIHEMKGEIKAYCDGDDSGVRFRLSLPLATIEAGESRED
ncbi:Histidine kinase domain-containing protein [Sulfidibacter corallicola]|uniref:Histidine kinase domain-containing protein n=1 Tax=Sulfidibacter corallicola TaxID=2818388 RepID=A0A8A4TVX1_SULCO|nr:two-component regulator propeller domain-containing protein [Sulfidibacter corallicola]QTD54089.1 hypothetical protein J3U87_16710 [Sulfidibacter corallicola]